MASVMWTREQDDLLRMHYALSGSNIPELSQFTKAQIRNRAFKLCLTRVDWTDDELSLLLEFYSTCGSNIPGLERKSKAAIHARANKLGLVYDGGWTPEEDSLIRSQYPVVGDAISELSHRSVGAIRSRAHTLGVSKGCHRKWTEKHISILKVQYRECGSEIPELLKEFSASAIVSKAESLGLRVRQYWTDDEIELLKMYYPKYGIAIPGLDRQANSIKKKAAELGLSCVRRPNVWTDGELVILRESLETGIVPVFETHSYDSVKSKAASLGLLKSRKWTDDEVDLLKNKYESVGPSGMVKLLPGRPYQTIVSKANRLGLCTLSRFRDRSRDVKKVIPAFDSFVYCTCTVCDKVFLVYGDGYKTFSHITHSRPIPVGWRTCVSSEYLVES